MLTKKSNIIKISAVLFIAFAGLAAAQDDGEIGYSIDGYLQNLYPVGTYSDYVSTGAATTWDTTTGW